MRKTKIICTIGPASEKPDVFKKIVSSGANVIRLNFSHGTHDEHKKRIDMIKRYRQEMNIPIAIILDTKGPEIRTGIFKNNSAELVEGQKFILTNDDVIGDQDHVSITYKGLVNDVKKDSRILIDDGLIELNVDETVNSNDIICTVVNGGVLSDQKGINVPGVSTKLPAVTEKDIDDIKFGIENGVDYIAASFIRKASDVLEIRKVLEKYNGSYIQIISKIEAKEAVTNFDEILKVSDGIMVARGDLGVEIPTEDVPIAQKQIIKKCNFEGKPVITATQMLDSMIRNPRPTRAEANDVANAIYDGTDAIMLSGETAAGKYPVESVATMAKIASRVENAISYHEIFDRKYKREYSNITNAISHATCTTAMDLGAAAIIAATKSGYTSRMVSKYRPACPIIATTTSNLTYNKLSLIWGVFPFLAPQMKDTDEVFEKSVDIAVKSGIVKNGDLVVITAGVPVAVSGTTNIIKVHIVGDILVRGKGIGTEPAYGKICIVNSILEAQTKFEQGDILVTQSTDNRMLPFMKKASAVITEKGNVNSHAAIVGLTLEIPVIVMADQAMDILHDGLYVTVDPVRGFVYNGKAKVL